MYETDKLLEKIEKEFETAKKKGEVSERIIELVSELQIQNEKLKENEEKFRVISEAAPVSIAIYRDYKFLYVNPYEESILEYTKEELLKMNFIDLVHPDYKKMVKNKVKARMQGNSEPDNYEIKIITKSGKEKWMELSTDLIQYNSLPAGIIISVNVTERKKAEKALKESEEKFRILSDYSPIAIVVYRDKYLYMNQAAVSILGYNKDEVLQMDLEEIIHPDYRKFIKNKINEIMDGNQKQSGEIKMITKTGKEIWIDVSSKTILYEGSPALMIIGLDITELKKAEEKLRKARDTLGEQVEKRTAELKEAYDSLKASELKFKTLTENSPDIINRIDKEFKNVYINPEITNISNRPPEYFIGKKMDELGIPEEFTVPLIEKAKNVFETGTMGEFVTEIPTIKGLRTFYTYIAPEYDENGNTNTILAVSRDVTELKQAEYQLKETLNELERSNEELQQFAYVSSHDLQEPLRTIASFTQLLERRYKGRLDSDADEFIDYIVEAAKRMKAQIEGLLEYSRVGTKGGEFKPVDMNLILNQTLQNLNVSMREANAEITHEELPTINGDFSQLQRVFQNLISNAIKFRKPEDPPKIHISANKSEDGKEYVFSVNDNGIGIETQYKERIFTIFQQLHTRDEYGGT
ncbi:MAG: PAS domain S-box protein, partial [Methanobacterium sp.]